MSSVWPRRKPLQLHRSASEPRRDGAPGRGSIPSTGAQQQAPLRQELLLPQERHLHTVSRRRSSRRRRRFIVYTQLIVSSLSGVCRKVVFFTTPPTGKCCSLGPVSSSLSLFRPPLVILTGIINADASCTSASFPPTQKSVSLEMRR